MSIKVIAFDADDTLWVNEPYFQAIEQEFCLLLEDFLPSHAVSKELLQTEIRNLPVYGYGIKGFILSMIETALTVSDNTLDPGMIKKIIQFGQEMLARPMELMPGIEEVLLTLRRSYRLVLATKGDLLDQERKLQKSGIEHHFHHIEIMSNKFEKDYIKLIKHLDIVPDAFMMIGNSIKSDILPVLNIGAHAIHVPFHTTWAHEEVGYHIEHPRFRQVERIDDILELIET